MPSSSVLPSASAAEVRLPKPALAGELHELLVGAGPACAVAPPGEAEEAGGPSVVVVPAVVLGIAPSSRVVGR